MDPGSIPLPPQLGPTSPQRPRPWALLALLASRIMSPELWSHWIWMCDGVRIMYMWPVSSILNPYLLTGGHTGCKSTDTLWGRVFNVSTACLPVHPSLPPSIHPFIQLAVIKHLLHGRLYFRHTQPRHSPRWHGKVLKTCYEHETMKQEMQQLEASDIYMPK